LRLLAALTVSLASIGWAPLQCGGEPEGDLRRWEEPGEALYGLAQQFKARGDEAAWRATLEYLVARHPNSRYASRAREELAQRKQ
jgi:hypothetical protein